MDKKTKILATLGPASNSLEMIEKLIDAGANMFRLNFSHGSHEYHQETLDNIRKAMENKKKIVGILQDISGPKIRVGELKEPFLLESGDIITFCEKEIIGEKRADKDYIVSINYPDILKKIKVDADMFAGKDIVFTDDINVLKEASFFIVTVPTPVDEYKVPDLTPLEKASETVGKVLKQGDYVVYESTTYPGCTEDDCMPPRAAPHPV